MPGASNDGGEDGTGCVISGEASLAHAGAIVYYQSGNIVVTHDVEICLWLTQVIRKRSRDVHTVISEKLMGRLQWRETLYTGAAAAVTCRAPNKARRVPYMATAAAILD